MFKLLGFAALATFVFKALSARIAQTKALETPEAKKVLEEAKTKTKAEAKALKKSFR